MIRWAIPMSISIYMYAKYYVYCQGKIYYLIQGDADDWNTAGY